MSDIDTFAKHVKAFGDTPVTPGRIGDATLDIDDTFTRMFVLLETAQEKSRTLTAELAAVKAERDALRVDAERLLEICKDAPNIFAHMLSTSRSCAPMKYLLTHDGMYGFHMANLNVRNDGKDYNMEADWADNCGKLVKHLTQHFYPALDITNAEKIYENVSAAIDAAREKGVG